MNTICSCPPKRLVFGRSICNTPAICERWPSGSSGSRRGRHGSEQISPGSKFPLGCGSRPFGGAGEIDPKRVYTCGSAKFAPDIQGVPPSRATQPDNGRISCALPAPCETYSRMDLKIKK